MREAEEFAEWLEGRDHVHEARALSLSTVAAVEINIRADEPTTFTQSEWRVAMVSPESSGWLVVYVPGYEDSPNDA